MDLTTAPGAPPGEGVFVVELEPFQGPLDLLLHLIREQDINIFDIPIARITEQFLAAIEGMGAERLEDAGSFLEMAATLLRIKLQMLLPRHEGEEEEEDPRAELVRRLLEYEQIREVALRLSAAEADRARRYGKGYIEPRPERTAEEQPLEVTWAEVHAAALTLEGRRPPPTEHRLTARPVSIDEKIKLIIETLARVARIEFRRLIKPWGSRLHAVATLLAGLELVRRHAIAMRQSQPFAELWLYRREESADQREGKDV
ncbi:MAG: segregation/condensation protein A [Gemmatimonadetes bacterium]|nr:segregation/condensation protein A [Gemmatimonadota bacterium]